MSESMTVMALPKDKVAARKLISIFCGRKANEKDKREYTTSFTTHESPKKKENIEYLDFFDNINGSAWGDEHKKF